MHIEANLPSASAASETIEVTETSPAPMSATRLAGKLSSNRQVAVVQADYVALANDLEQAHALTASLDLQLSGKCNELSQFKHLWERTKADMQKFEHDLETLRKERHALANQVQIAMATEHRFEKLKREHEQLRARTERLEGEFGAERVLHADARRNVDDLQVELDDVRRRAANTAGPGLDPAFRSELQMLRNQLDRLLDLPIASSPPRRTPAPPENINITFGR